MLQAPDPYRYLGNVPVETRQGYQEWQSSDARRAQIAEAIGEELPLTELQYQQFSDAFDATRQYYADRLGVNISDRVPPVENVHLLSEQNFRSLQRRMGIDHEGVDISGLQIAENDLVIRATGDTAMEAYIAQHEFIHMIGQRSVRMIPITGALPHVINITPRELRRGFQPNVGKNDGSKAIEEYTAEAASRDIITNYWPKYESLKDLRPKFVAHDTAVELGNVVAEGVGTSKEEMLRDVMAAHVSGRMKYLEKITAEIEDKWGAGTTREITKVTSAKAGDLAIKLTQNTKP